MILYLLTWKEKTDVEKLDCSDNATNCVDFETQMKRKTRADCRRLYSTGNLHAHSQDGLRG